MISLEIASIPPSGRCGGRDAEHALRVRDRPDEDAAALAAVRALGNDRGCYLGAGPTFAPTEHGVLVLGPPRSGKTSSIVVPNVLAAPGAVLAASTKADVLHATARSRARTGPVVAFDPSGDVPLPAAVRRVGWSPVTSSLAWDRAVLVADAMVGAHRGAPRAARSHWEERAGALLAPLLHAAAVGGASMREVVHAVHRRDVRELIAVLAHHGADLPLDLLTGIAETDDRERSGIFSTAASVLAAYRTDGAIRVTELAPFDADAFLAEGGTCFIVSSAEHQRHLAPLVAGLVGDVRHAAYSGRHPGRHALLVLDELANIAPLDDLPALVAEGASQGLVTLACLQDLSQARARWGDAADGFLSLFGTKVVLPGIGDRATLESVSLLGGDHDVTTWSRSGRRRRRSRGWSRSTRRERRVAPHDIADGPAGTAIVVVGASVGRLTLTPAYATPPFDRLVADGPVRTPPRRFRGRGVGRSRAE